LSDQSAHFSYSLYSNVFEIQKSKDETEYEEYNQQ